MLRDTLQVSFTEMESLIKIRLTVEIELEFEPP